jgi:hypothetical protein
MTDEPTATEGNDKDEPKQPEPLKEILDLEILEEDSDIITGVTGGITGYVLGTGRGPLGSGN